MTVAWKSSELGTGFGAAPPARNDGSPRVPRAAYCVAQPVEVEAMALQAEGRAVRRPEMDRKWSPAIEELVLDVVARTGSPKRAAEAAGVSTATIHDHRRRDPEFGTSYAEAMDAAFHGVLGRAFERSLDEEQPSDRLIEVLLKFRFVDRAPAFDPTAPGVRTDGPAGLDPRVIARMAPADRAALAAALGAYVVTETELHADDALTILNP
ncbi:hypothetical protein IY145_21210 [Methylosinus sp. H3A]|uniref:hypothetical protein n=1 Tax=Methylosinus sp. H3A TaxID=2785786 RepID=UPI0018C1E8D0|nr:hypothetical protein [Methylosinus sp. H3A]MBG0811871.1 hypothetical protein [Methylosinus sp. H3A]